MIMVRKTILIAIVFMAVLGGCRKGNKFQPSKLISPLSSGQSLLAVQRTLEWQAGSWDVLTDRRPLSSDTRPPFRILVISKKNWMHHGNPGELVLTFFNDRLMTAQFYPVDMEQYETSLANQDQLGFSDVGDTKIPPSTRVWIGKDETGRSYVGWIDKVLQAEHDAWVKQYS